MKNLFLLFTLGLFVFSSCKEDEEPVDEPKFDHHAHIHSPNTDAKHVNDTIHIHVVLESRTGEPVHHANVRIYNKLNNTEVYNKPDVAHVHEADGKYEYYDDFILSNDNGIMEYSDWVLEAKVWGDGAGIEEEMESIEFHVHPE